MAVNYKYNYDTGNWDKVYVADSTPVNQRPDAVTPPASSTAGSSSTTTKTNASDNRASTETAKASAVEFIEDEVFTIKGEAEIIPDPKIRAKKTVKMNYLGRHLSGVYFVEEMRLTIDSSGLSQSLTLSKSGFGDSMKLGNLDKPIGSVPSPGLVDSSQTPVSTRPPEATPAPIPTANSKVQYINKNGRINAKAGLNIRNSPVSDSPNAQGYIANKSNVIKALSYNTTVFVVFKEGDWLKISKPIEGYCYAKYVTY